MALFRSGVLTGTASARLYYRLLAAGGIGLLFRLGDLAWQARTGFELDIHRMSLPVSILRSAGYEPARLALTLAWIALILLLFRSGRSAKPDRCGRWVVWR